MYLMHVTDKIIALDTAQRRRSLYRIDYRGIR